MCKDDDRIIESLVAQVNELQDKLKQSGTPEGIPEGLTEAEVKAITDIYQYRVKHPDMKCYIAHYETASTHVINITFMHKHHELTSVNRNTLFNVVISGANYEADKKDYYRIIDYLKEILKIIE